MTPPRECEPNKEARLELVGKTSRHRLEASHDLAFPPLTGVTDRRNALQADFTATKEQLVVIKDESDASFSAPIHYDVKKQIGNTCK